MALALLPRTALLCAPAGSGFGQPEREAVRGPGGHCVWHFTKRSRHALPQKNAPGVFASLVTCIDDDRLTPRAPPNHFYFLPLSRITGFAEACKPLQMKALVLAEAKQTEERRDTRIKKDM